MLAEKTSLPLNYKVESGFIITLKHPKIYSICHVLVEIGNMEEIMHLDLWELHIEDIYRGKLYLRIRGI